MSKLNKIDLSGNGGVLKEVLKDGSGDDCPVNGCKVSLHYTGKLADGTIFDSSVSRGEPFEFDLGKGAVIKAFDLGVPTMKAGEKCILTCGPEYAYGAAGSPPSIPPNATLIFELEILNWKGEDISPNQDGSIERFIIEASDKKRSPTDGALVNVHLIGKLNGDIFDDRDVQFDYGEGCDCGIIEGVEIALKKMAVGETSKVLIQPRYAFGVKGSDLYSIPTNAKVEYIINLVDCEKGVEEWKLNNDERINQSMIYKDKGTTYFHKNNFQLAIKMYKKSLELLPDDANSVETKQLKIAGNNNIGLCYQKTGDYFEAKQACNEVLEADPDNIKAIYRRGQCNIAINEYNDALKDFNQIIQLESTNKAALNQIQVCKRNIKESIAEEKKMYMNMFSKFSAADKEHETIADSDVLTKCGEWSDEDAKHEVDMAFERDNNIVMI